MHNLYIQFLLLNIAEQRKENVQYQSRTYSRNVMPQAATIEIYGHNICIIAH